MFGEGSNRNANKTPEKCERCEQVKYCKTEWNIFRGFNSYCSIIGGKCNIYDGHHTHQVCNACVYELNSRSKRNAKRLQAQKEDDERCINRAKEYIWEKCDCRIENGVILRNQQMTKDLKLKDKERPKYQNHCEHCGTLLNTYRQNWMLFSFPSPYDRYYTRSEILTCKTCFRDLSEEYFGMKEEEYQSLLSDVIHIPQEEEVTNNYY
jgi:hypothetical protein